MPSPDAALPADNPNSSTHGGSSGSRVVHDADTVSFLDRLEHFTWAWFCCPMATGGIVLLLSPDVQPHTFSGLETIGKTVYILDLVIFTVLSICMTYRFFRWPRAFIDSFTHPSESLFAATPQLALASIIAAIARYGIPACGPWLVVVYRVMFWIYFAISFCWGIGAYTLLFTSPALKIEDMNPGWDLPIFPFMLSGTIAASGSHLQPPHQALPMIVAGLTAQGLGFIMSILMYALYIHRMIQYGLPGYRSRPSMFIAAGPPSFTALALIGLADDWPRVYINYFGDNIPYSFADDVLNSQQQQLISIHIMRTLATLSAVFIWSLAFWFFCIALVACIIGARHMTFHLNWWAFVFPNVGFTIATISIGKMLQSQGIQWVGSIMTIGLVCTWFFVAVKTIQAVWTKQVLWSGKDEDVYSQVGQAKKDKLARSGNSGKNEGDMEKQD